MPWDEFTRYFTDISVCQLSFRGSTHGAKSVDENESFDVQKATAPESATTSADGVGTAFAVLDCWSTNGVKSGVSV